MRWQVASAHEEVWIAAKHEESTEKLVHLFSPNVAAWRTDEWLGSPSSRPALLEIASYLGEPTANGSIQGVDELRTRVQTALREGRLIAYRRDEVVHALPV